MVFNSIQTVLMIFLILAVGYILCVKKVIVPEQHSAALSKIITYIAAPCVLFNYMMTNFTRDMLRQSYWYFAVVLAVQLLAFALGYVLAPVVKVPKNRRGLFAIMCAQSNTIFVGMPVCVGIFGAQSIPYVLYYYAMNTAMFWTLGYAVLQRDAGNSKPAFSIKALKKSFPAPISAFLLSMLLIALGVKVPEIVMMTAETIGGMTTPLAVLYVGVVLYQAGLKNIKPDFPLSVMAIIRIVIAPAATFLIARLMGMGSLPTEVFTVQSAMPVMTFTVVYAGMVGADSKYAMRGVVLTTFLSLLAIPLYMAVMPLL